MLRQCAVYGLDLHTHTHTHTCQQQTHRILEVEPVQFKARALCKVENEEEEEVQTRRNNDDHGGR